MITTLATIRRLHFNPTTRLIALIMIRGFITALVLAASATMAPANNYSVRAWQSEDGLPGNVVRSVVQSSDGFLWIASPEGIARFDGTEFVTLDPPDEIRLSRIGPNRLFATPDGAVWFSGPRVGLLRIVEGTMQRVLDGDPSPHPLYVSQVVSIDSQTIVARRGSETWNVSESPPRLLDPPDPLIEVALTKDLTQRAINGRILPDNTTGQLVDHLGNLWSANNGPGITLNAPDESPIALDFRDLDGSITASEFLEDREGNVWAATPVSGLIRFRQLRAEVIAVSDGLSERAVNSVIQDASGDFWFGTRSGGVDRMSGTSFDHYEFSPETSGPRRAASALFVDRSDRLWTAARDGSVFVWNGSAFEVAFPRQPTPSKIDAIYQDADDTFWFGGARGLVRVDGETITPLGPAQRAPRSHVTCMTGDDSGHLWFGTMNGRIFREENDQFISIGGKSHLGGRGISDLRVENPNHAWAATLGSGLHFWDGQRWHRFDHRQGLPDSRLTCILSDDQGHLWLGSLGGIFRVPKAELLARIDKPEVPLHWLRIDRSDGLPTRECSGSSHPSGWRATDGQLYFPTSRGVVRIDPATIEVNLAAPPVFLRGVSADGVPLAASDEIFKTGPGRTRLEFAYHGLGFTSPEKTTYRTRLLGLDQTWREAGSQRVSTFEAVPPGRYQFEVISVNGDGIWSDPTTLAEILVTPQFWESPWFILSAIAAAIATAAGAGWIVARVRLKRRIQTLKLHQALEDERARISRDLHDDLGASLTELSILSALAAEDADDRQLRPSLDLVSGKAKTVVGTLDEIVWAATPSEDSLRSLIEYLAAFAREFLENADINLRSDILRNIPDYTIGPNRRHNIFLASREAINNTVKHSGASEVRLQITLEEQQLVIRINDNGKGFNLDYAASGNGLTNLRKRMSDCGGSCHIESRPGAGSTVTLSLPLPR